ncbi:unnamed protein product [Dibothriocephalus latus]|uniref:F-BAR domain-containing protein n=1 Tax=Dibothriocephalus latus TaxID=60516 RepID=A0A3P7NKH1_DIBLA|nr:unnamed protein product [Dibothriocephalus latus]
MSHFQWCDSSYRLEKSGLQFAPLPADRRLYFLNNTFSLIMHTSENETENGSARSFWEPKQYARTVKRLETANKLCSEYALMIQERSDIEKAYASNLRKWSQKWNTFRESGLEYGTGANVFSGLCTEAEQRADLHSTVANSLTESVQSAVKSWQKSKFHKTSISSTIKEVRSLESEFEAAQKVWYKRFKAVHRAQKEYYHACKTVGSLQVQVQNAKNDPNGTAEQLRKIEEKLSKAEHDKVKTKDAYNYALGNLTDENMHYIDEMTKVFDKSQALEKDRLEFFKSQALEIHKCLDLSKAVQLSDIYKKLEETLNLVDSEADLKQWSFEHGVDMPTNFPKFQVFQKPHMLLYCCAKVFFPVLSCSCLIICNLDIESVCAVTKSVLLTGGFKGLILVSF